MHVYLCAGPDAAHRAVGILDTTDTPPPRGAGGGSGGRPTVCLQAIWHGNGQGVTAMRHDRAR